MSTRTVVKFGTVLNNLIRDRMSYFQEAFTEVTSQHLLYGYRKPISVAYTGFVLIQASRTQGRFGMEVAISRNTLYPYHRFADHPDIGFTGYREAVFTLLKNYNHSEEYQSSEGLFRVLYSSLKDAEMALSRLMERTVAKIQREYELWHPLYSKWLELEQKASGPSGRRYPSVSAEALAFEIIEDILAAGTFDRYLGPLKYRYRNPHFLNCHVYLLARALEFLEPPDPPLNPIGGDPPAGRKIIPPLDDPISALTGRWPQQMSVELAVTTSSKTTQFAFLKSLSAVEGLLQLNEAGNPVRHDGFHFFSDSVGESLIEGPDYADHSFVNFTPPPAPVVEPPPPPPPAPPPPPPPAPAIDRHDGVLKHRVEPKKPKKPAFSLDDADDPIAMLESRFGLR